MKNCISPHSESHDFSLFIARRSDRSGLPAAVFESLYAALHPDAFIRFRIPTLSVSYRSVYHDDEFRIENLGG